MQVIPPTEFARLVFGATAARNPRSFYPNLPAFRPQPHPNLFHVPVYKDVGQTHSTIKEMSRKIQSLERDVHRLHEELKIRGEISRREKMVRDALKSECEDLRDEIDRLRSVLHAREREIYDLERQLRSSQTQLVLMMKKLEAASTAVSAKGSPSPGSISSLPKELRSIGTQVNEVNDLEYKVEHLQAALRIEKDRNRRIKSLIVEHESSGSSVPPLPIHERSKSVPARRPFTSHSLAGKVVIQRPQPPVLTQQVFLELNAMGAPPPPIEPTLLSPIKRAPGLSFQVFEDKENLTVARDMRGKKSVNVLQQTATLERANVIPELITSPFRKSTSSSLQPPPFVPQLNLAALSSNSPADIASARSVQSTSSETAIKRAVAAAIEKRKQLANQGVSLGSGRSSILGASSFMSNSPINISGVKARFCLPLG